MKGLTWRSGDNRSHITFTIQGRLMSIISRILPLKWLLYYIGLCIHIQVKLKLFGIYMQGVYLKEGSPEQVWLHSVFSGLLVLQRIGSHNETLTQCGLRLCNLFMPVALYHPKHHIFTISIWKVYFLWKYLKKCSPQTNPQHSFKYFMN